MKGIVWTLGLVFSLLIWWGIVELISRLLLR
jgi:hypothetical protein